PLRRAARLQSGSSEIAVRCIDVGIGGIAVIAATNLSTESRCFVRFELPLRAEGVANLGLACSVAHCIYSHRESGFVVGLKFESVSEDARKLLERYLER
ncbi:MAG: PilZ domain-containing protein, partial [Pseudomonadota bacterium]|nr:PilZ domain-containing protein [Pseudomonadota bacterium]